MILALKPVLYAIFFATFGESPMIALGVVLGGNVITLIICAIKRPFKSKLHNVLLIIMDVLVIAAVAMMLMVVMADEQTESPMEGIFIMVEAGTLVAFALGCFGSAIRTVVKNYKEAKIEEATMNQE